MYKFLFLKKTNIMKRFKILGVFICIILVSIFFVSCKSERVDTYNLSPEYAIAEKILESKNIQNYSDETIKAFSIVLRTKIMNGEKSLKAIDEFDDSSIEKSNASNLEIADNTLLENNLLENSLSSDNFSEDNLSDDEFLEDENKISSISEKSKDSEIEEIQKRVLSLVKSTAGKVLVKKNDNDSISPNQTIEYIYDDENYLWEKTISKSSILKFLSNQNISLSNISKFQLNKTDDGLIDSISIAGKTMSYKLLKENFDLPSSKILNFETNLSNLKISGKGVCRENIFVLEKSNELSAQGMNFSQLLNNFFEGYFVKTI